MSAFNTPVLVLIFNRVDKTKVLLNRLREIQPKQLFIAADGARPHKEGEAQKCEQTRAVFNEIDWDCEVKHLYRDENLGCRNAVSSAITWFFEHVEQGIILEDDCVPHSSFFPFCAAMLDKYKDNEQVYHITAHNPLGTVADIQESYFFSKQALVWGWATWRRAWESFDINMKNLPEFLNEGKIKDFIDYAPAQQYIQEKWELAKAKKLDSWAYPWAFSCVAKGGLAIIPKHNLIHNIGFDEEATHTHTAKDIRVKQGLSFPLQHPSTVLTHSKRERNIFFSSQKSKRGLIFRASPFYSLFKKITQ